MNTRVFRGQAGSLSGGSATPGHVRAHAGQTSRDRAVSAPPPPQRCLGRRFSLLRAQTAEAPTPRHPTEKRPALVEDSSSLLVPVRGGEHAHIYVSLSGRALRFFLI